MGSYKIKHLMDLDYFYDAKMLFLQEDNPEKPINDWVNQTTNGKIDKIIGKSKLNRTRYRVYKNRVIFLFQVLPFASLWHSLTF